MRWAGSGVGRSPRIMHTTGLLHRSANARSRAAVEFKADYFDPRSTKPPAISSPIEDQPSRGFRANSSSLDRLGK